MKKKSDTILNGALRYTDEITKKIDSLPTEKAQDRYCNRAWSDITAIMDKHGLAEIDVWLPE